MTDPPGGLLGVGDLEEADQEFLDGFRPARGGRRRLRVGLGAFRLPGRGGESADQRGQHENRGRDAHAIAPDEFREPVAEGVGTRLDGLALAMPPEIAAEGRDRGVSPLGLASQRGEKDGVEIAPQPPLEPPAVALRRARERERGDLFAGDPLARLLLHVLRGGGRERRAAPLALLRKRPGQELVTQRAEGPHVGRRRDGLAQDLLRRRVGRSEKAELRAGLGGGLAGVVGTEKLRDAEVQELDLSALRDEDVGGLQVAVHDEVAVRRRHRVAAVLQELEARLDGETP